MHIPFPHPIQVPDYLDVIKHPMDFSTMRKKVESHQYSSLNEFEGDFYHVWHNATIYNQPDTIYYKAATQIRDAGRVSLQCLYTVEIRLFYPEDFFCNICSKCSVLLLRLLVT